MDAQVQLIQDIYKRAGLEISETAYVEADMTGTNIREPLEEEALAKTFGQSRQSTDPILVGSVKTNIGQTRPVTGIASVIKTSFALRNGVIPSNLNYEIPNKHIPLDRWNLQVPTTLTPWPKDKPFRASINNFGYGGTNAHVIMERAPAVPRKVIYGKEGENGNGNINGSEFRSNPDQSRVYILSAKDSNAIKEIANKFAV